MSTRFGFGPLGPPHSFSAELWEQEMDADDKNLAWTVLTHVTWARLYRTSREVTQELLHQGNQ